MTLFDYAVLTGIALSILLGMWRGVASELLALAAWVLAIVLGKVLSPVLAPELVPWITDPTLRYMAAFASITVAVMLLASVVRFLASGFLRAVGLGLIDRFLGAIFGLVRGVALVVALVAVGGLTTFPKQVWWRDSMLALPLETAVVAMKPWLPREWAGRIRYR